MHACVYVCMHACVCVRVCATEMSQTQTMGFFCTLLHRNHGYKWNHHVQLSFSKKPQTKATKDTRTKKNQVSCLVEQDTVPPTECSVTNIVRICWLFWTLVSNNAPEYKVWSQEVQQFTICWTHKHFLRVYKPFLQPWPWMSVPLMWIRR